jgi:hypothetical protein
MEKSAANDPGIFIYRKNGFFSIGSVILDSKCSKTHLFKDFSTIPFITRRFQMIVADYCVEL